MKLAYSLQSNNEKQGQITLPYKGILYKYVCIEEQRDGPVGVIVHRP